MRSLTTSIPIRILTHNIRYATRSPSPGEEPWPIRKPLLISQLRFHTRHNPESFICLQEVLHGQLVDILSGLNDRPGEDNNNNEWTWIGVGRDDGHLGGEFSPILYRPSTWTVLKSQTLWLSPTPHRPSKGWDANLPRILTTGLFQHNTTAHQVAILTTHFDDGGQRSRIEAAKIVAAEVDGWWAGRGVPVLLTGDFNGEEALRRLGEESELSGLVGPWERYGEGFTFTGFLGERRDRKRIDFIFCAGFGGGREEGGREPAGSPAGYAVLSNRFEDGVYVSDHRAVVGDVVLL